MKGKRGRADQSGDEYTWCAVCGRALKKKQAMVCRKGGRLALAHRECDFEGLPYRKESYLGGTVYILHFREKGGRR